MSAAPKKKRKPRMQQSLAIPHHYEAERCILGLVLLSPKAWAFASSVLVASDFYEARHRSLWKACEQADMIAGCVEIVTVLQYTKDWNLPQLDALVDEPPGNSVRHWCRIVLQKAKLRQLWGVLGQTDTEIHNEASYHEVMVRLQSQLREIERRGVWMEHAATEQWQASLEWSFDKSGKRKLARSQANFTSVLTNDHRLAGVLVYDQFRRDIISRIPPPWNESQMLGPTATNQPWTDNDYNKLLTWLEQEYGAAPTLTNLYGLCAMIAERSAYHPILDALDELQWDGEPRLDSWLQTYAGAAGDPPEYLSFVGRAWMIGAIARVRSPGCQMDNMLVLEGRQGIGKTQLLRTLGTLTTGSWYIEANVKIGDKDLFDQLQGGWIAEVPEMEMLERASDNAVKGFLSSIKDRYRPAYGRTTLEFPRQVVFAGTTNQDDYLRDETGARRYWPVRCRSIDMEALRADKDQLWAEADHRYQQGEKWYATTPELDQLCRDAQARRQLEDVWYPKFVEHLANTTAKDYTAQELLERVCNIPLDKVHIGLQKRVAHIMAQTPGWEKGRVKRAGKKLQGYVRAKGGGAMIHPLLHPHGPDGTRWNRAIWSNPKLSLARVRAEWTRWTRRSLASARTYVRTCAYVSGPSGPVGRFSNIFSYLPLETR